MRICVNFPQFPCIFSARAEPPPDYPCGKDWKYSPLSGKCYKFYETPKTWEQSNDVCRNLRNGDGARNGRTFLTKLESHEDVVSLRKIIGTNFEQQWTYGYFESTGKFWI